MNTPDGAGSLPTGKRAGEQLDDAGAWPLARWVARWEEGEPLVRERELPRFLRDMKSPLPLDAQAPASVEPREYPFPPELYRDLQELAPQALLRDLHRPVREFHAIPEYHEGTEIHGQLSAAYRELYRVGHREEIPTIESMALVVRAEQRRRRAFLSERWRPSRPDDAPRDKIDIYPTFTAFGD